ncbi:hypothetical protein ACS0TY_005928 [Phlomoides rotata]
MLSKVDLQRNPTISQGNFPHKNQKVSSFLLSPLSRSNFREENREMSETSADAPTASKSKPTIMVPPRGSVGFLFANGPAPGFSPGPMTLVSNFFPEQTPFSFSQLLAMASPLTPKTGFLPTYDSCKVGPHGSLSSRPASLALAPPPPLESLSPLFLVAPGMTLSGLMNSPGFLSPLQSPFGMSHQQALAHVTAQAALSQFFKQMQAEYQHSSSPSFIEAVPNTSSPNFIEAAPYTSSPIYIEAAPNTSSPVQAEKPSNPDPERSKKESEVSQSDKRTGNVAGDKPASDGYNWRKYGQKQVKASECPRSYYKCTQLNCPVRKKVEQSLEGHVSEITYKGQHNHDPPKPNNNSVSDKPTKAHVKPVSTSQHQSESERLSEAITVNSATSLPVNSCNDNTKDIVIVVDVEDPVEPIAKRRSLGTGASMPNSSSQKAVTDTKIVLQTRSEVDYLDDGYKWRKYGQKVVKGNPHPRSYYRCTYAGCSVRKHVERASDDPKMVITTYEGKHNHDIPVGRYSSSSAQSTKAQKVVSKDPSIDPEIDYGNRGTKYQQVYSSKKRKSQHDPNLD